MQVMELVEKIILFIHSGIESSRKSKKPVLFFGTRQAFYFYIFMKTVPEMVLPSASS